MFNAEPPLGNSLLLTTKSPAVPDTNMIDLGRVKGLVLTLEPSSGFEPGTPGLGIQYPHHQIGYVRCICFFISCLLDLT